MRTTLDIADDVLQAAWERAQREHRTAGQAASELLRLNESSLSGREHQFGRSPGATETTLYAPVAPNRSVLIRSGA